MRRTTDQNAYLHKYLRVLAENMYSVENHGLAPTKKAGCKKWINTRMVELKAVFAFHFLGNPKEMFPHTSDLSKEEFSAFLDQIHLKVSEIWPDLAPVNPRDESWGEG